VVSQPPFISQKNPVFQIILANQQTLYRRSFLTLRKITPIKSVDFCYKCAAFRSSKMFWFDLRISTWPNDFLR